VVTATPAYNPAGDLFPQLDPAADEPVKQMGLELWKPAVIDGHAWLPGTRTLILPEERAQRIRPPVGGSLARMLPSVVVAQDQQRQRAELPNASLDKSKTRDALGFVPPPLVNEGLKAQSAWLHDFLLDPYPIRPAVVLRMPKFNMSADEASILANYFAAIDGAEFPYAFDSRTRQENLAQEEHRFPDRLEDAKTFVRTICLQCHRLGDFVPTRYDQAPNLADVYHRVRPDFLKEWVANPKRLLPYTVMPEHQLPPPTKTGPLDKTKPDHRGNFGAPVGAIFDPARSGATSEDQLDAVVDFLLNYDRLSQQNEKVEALKAPEKEKPKDTTKETMEKASAKGKEPAGG
jgi:hypothetical protein